MKKGFTLVELSIVLVIIGLLIGGILVAQSLVDSAKANNTVRKVQQLEIAVNLFQDRFRNLPGDTPLFTPSGAPDNVLVWGDTDGDGEPNVGATCVGQNLNREDYNFWGHLSLSGMVNETYELYSPTSCGGPHANPYTKEQAPIFLEDNNDAVIRSEKSNANIPLAFAMNTTVVENIQTMLSVALKLGLSEGPNPGGSYYDCEDDDDTAPCQNDDIISIYVHYQPELASK